MTAQRCSATGARHRWRAGGATMLAGLAIHVAGCGGARAQPDGAAVPPLFASVGAVAPVEDRGRSRGAAWGDYDGDGYPDLFVTRATYDPSVPVQGNVLYRNAGGGRFTRVEAAPTTDRDGDAEGAVWVDVDNDGDLDLHVVFRTGTGSVVYENTGSGTFVRRDDPFGGGIRSASMACWADVDGDGHLDVFVVGYGAGRNALYRNAGGWRFERAALSDAAVGRGDGRACGWGDLDGDGLPELVVATARGPNLLLRNRGGFDLVPDTTTALHRDSAYGYGVSWADVNGDGLRDLFIANFDGPNTLYLGTPGGGLEPSELGTRLESAATKGHAWGDFDLDGREDLYLGSGTPAPGMLNRLHLATGPSSFRMVTTGEALAHADTSAAVAAADYDLDGDLDLFVANWGGLASVNRLYRNDAPPRAWLRVRLEGVRSNRMGVGARVSVLADAHDGQRWQHRWLDAATGYAGQNEPVLHFGLGSATRVDSLVVRWPSGIVDRYGATAVRAVHALREGAGATSTAADTARTGRFRTADGAELAIFRAALGLAFLHYPSGRLGVLHAVDTDRYVAGPGAMGREPVQVEIALLRSADGTVDAATYRAGGAVQQFRRQPPFRTVDARVTHGDVGLATSATLPPGGGPFPVVVINHGGGPGVRADVQLWADWFAGLGVASVAYDKRGSGETVGPNWATFADLAADAAAAIGWAKRQPWAAPACVGTWAYSQSGWVVPLAARDEPVAFIIAISVPALSPAGRALASVRPRLLADGLSRDDADAAHAFIRLVDEFGRGRFPWEDYSAALAEARGTAWFDRVEKPTTEGAPRTPFYDSEFGRYLDPLPYWSRIDVPVLAIYGGLDTTVPADANAPHLATTLSANRDATVEVLPGANHQLLQAVTGGDAELIDLNTYANRYFGIIQDFVRNRTAHCTGAGR